MYIFNIFKIYIFLFIEKVLRRSNTHTTVYMKQTAWNFTLDTLKNKFYFIALDSLNAFISFDIKCSDIEHCVNTIYKFNESAVTVLHARDTFLRANKKPID